MRHAVFKVLCEILPSDIAYNIASYLPSRYKKKKKIYKTIRYKSGNRKEKRRSISFDFHHIN